LASLPEAVEHLAPTEFQLDHARALVDLGAALRRGNERRASRDPLRQGMDIAHRCGATALVERARTELEASGARPRSVFVSGVDSLTPSELRVAELAVQGMTNREIAQRLFVTMKTVETHLRHCYQKLEIAGRGELAAALGAPESVATTS
jgi:DNA-binding NarL/FixJ family response regulator